MNFIFDIGNVLIDFKPKLFLKKLFDNTVYEKKINEIIFLSNEWIELDKGTITPEDACAEFCEKNPKYRNQIIKTMGKLSDMLTPITETIKLLPKIKEAGHNLYFLSNYHKELSIYAQNKYSFFNLFDGGVFSCDVHMIKPSQEIYLYLLNKYGLKPQDCIFFDDTKENADAATMLGIKGVLFSDVSNIISNI